MMMLTETLIRNLDANIAGLKKSRLYLQIAVPVSAAFILSSVVLHAIHPHPGWLHAFMELNNVAAAASIGYCIRSLKASRAVLRQAEQLKAEIEISFPFNATQLRQFEGVRRQTWQA